jgi:hypothetical protein
METLGWMIWGISSFFFALGLMRLGKKKGRVRRIFFCVCTATGLALTLFTSFSKFHLLWIVPLQFLLGLLLFGLIAGGALTYAKLTARKPKEKTLAPGSFPPFGELKWEDDGWEGKIKLPAWAGFQSRNGPYASQDSKSPGDGSVTVTITPAQDAKELTPSEAQCRSVKFHLENGAQAVQSVLAALVPYHRGLKKDWEMNDKEMPPVTDPEDFRKMIGLGQLHVLPHTADDVAYLGLEFGCDWEEEHGLGVVLHKDRVIEVGEASDAFSWQPPSANENGKDPGNGQRTTDCDHR